MRLLEDKQEDLFGIILPISQQDHSPEVIAAIRTKNLFVMYNKAIALEMPNDTLSLFDNCVSSLIIRNEISAHMLTCKASSLP